MTTLNPSHNIFRSSSGRHAQAVHHAGSNEGEPSNKPSVTPASTSSFPDSLPISDIDSSDLELDDSISPEEKTIGKSKKEGRRRVQRHVPPVPDLRFEQSYLLSIRPFLTPRPTKKAEADKGPEPNEADEKESKSLVVGAEDDSVFHWGRQVDVNWRMVTWITLRDQIISPLVQGAFWGWGTLFLAAAGASLRGALYPASHIPKGRITGGAGGKLDEAGGGSAVGGGWWRNFVKSWGGAIETAAV